MGHERRAFASGADAVGHEVLLSDSDSKHLIQVLRCRDGDPITIVSLETGREFYAELAINGRTAKAILKSEISLSRNNFPPDSLAIGLIKGAAGDLMIEKSVECGVKCLYFIEAERSVVKLGSAEERDKKIARFLKIAEGAAKQSSQNFIPKIRIFGSTAEYAEKMSAEAAQGQRLFVCSLEANARKLSELSPLRVPYHAAIGPEGDFSQAEYETLARAGFEPVSLGSSRLKSETAAIIAAAKLSVLREINEVP